MCDCTGAIPLLPVHAEGMRGSRQVLPVAEGKASSDVLRATHSPALVSYATGDSLPTLMPRVCVCVRVCA
jgi:hypothetical protein